MQRLRTETSRSYLGRSVWRSDVVLNRTSRKGATGSSRPRRCGESPAASERTGGKRRSDIGPVGCNKRSALHPAISFGAISIAPYAGYAGFDVPSSTKKIVKSGAPSLPALQALKVPDPLRERTRHLHNSIRTGAIYVHWVRAFIRCDCLRRHETARRNKRSRLALTFVRRWGRARSQAWRASRGMPCREARPMRLSALHARRAPFHAASRHAASRGRAGVQPKLNSREVIWYLKVAGSRLSSRPSAVSQHGYMKKPILPLAPGSARSCAVL